MSQPCKSTVCDVAVVGGGVAGIAAALSAARAGSKTILLEREFSLGGLATLGLVTIYLPLCDGCGRQVSFGIAEELLRLAVCHGAAEQDIPLYWNLHRTADSDMPPRLECRFDPNMFSLLAEQLLLNAGVEIWFGTQVCDAETTDDAIQTLTVQQRFSKEIISVRSVVDASGDAIVCALAGEDTASFRQQNILASWYYAQEADGLRLHILGAADTPDAHKQPECEPDAQKRYDGGTDASINEFVLDSHRAVLEDFLQGGDISAQHRLYAIAAIPQLRMTRRLETQQPLPEPEEYRHYPDSIGMIGNWKRRGPVYEIPFSCMRGRKNRNLCVAGRCIAADDTMWDCTRVIPACAVTGEAAGLAAALSRGNAGTDIGMLQAQLRARGIPLTLAELSGKEN